MKTSRLIYSNFGYQLKSVLFNQGTTGEFHKISPRCFSLLNLSDQRTKWIKPPPEYGDTREKQTQLEILQCKCLISKNSVLSRFAYLSGHKSHHLNTHWKDWCWSCNSSVLVIWCKQLTHWKSLWCWERLRAEEEGVRGWDGWTASPMQWTWTWTNSRRWWGIGRPHVLQSRESDTTGQLNNNNNGIKLVGLSHKGKRGKTQCNSLCLYK